MKRALFACMALGVAVSLGCQGDTPATSPTNTTTSTTSSDASSDLTLVTLSVPNMT